MLKPDFTRYSLALVDENKIIFSSEGHGLKSLWDCLENYRQAKKSFILYDKVIGLAAAKLVSYSGIISAIQALLISQPAKIYLEENHIKIEAKITVANILTKDRRSICPGEIIALNTDEPDDFRAKIKKMLSNF
jgi:hypothetical protein